MAFSNSVMVELMVPRRVETPLRLEGFFDKIGWEVRYDTDEDTLMYVNPQLEAGQPPTIAYWQSKDPYKLAQFEDQYQALPSRFCRGLRLPNIQELVEVSLVVPSPDEVQTIYEKGGDLLLAHAHVPLREHYGQPEFRFADPFNYSLRITADVGWQLAETVSTAGEREPSLGYATFDDFYQFAKDHPDYDEVQTVGRLWGRLIRFSRIFDIPSLHEKGPKPGHMTIEDTEVEIIRPVAGVMPLRASYAANMTEQTYGLEMNLDSLQMLVTSNIFLRLPTFGVKTYNFVQEFLAAREAEISEGQDSPEA